MSTTTTTAWAVGLDGGEQCWTGDTWEEASAFALEALVEEVDLGDRDPGEHRLEVYEDAEWCTAHSEEDDCVCGMAWVHDEGRDGMVTWRRSYGLTARVEIIDDRAELVEVEDLPAPELTRG